MLTVRLWSLKSKEYIDSVLSNYWEPYSTSADGETHFFKRLKECDRCADDEDFYSKPRAAKRVKK